MCTQHRSASWPAFFRRYPTHLFVAGLVALGGCSTVEAEHDGELSVAAPTPEEAGRYLIGISGCNDCHTDGYMETDGQIPESDRLTGSVVGWRGPWGTIYPPNLRLTVQAMTEDQWVEMLSTRTGPPPMPWPSVRHMSDTDKRSIYRYLRSLGPKGEVRTVMEGPEIEPSGPWIDLMPKNLPTSDVTG